MKSKLHGGDYDELMSQQSTNYIQPDYILASLTPPDSECAARHHSSGVGDWEGVFLNPDKYTNNLVNWLL